MAAGDEKPRFRCRDAARCAVASTVTVFILVVAVYAVVTVLRPGDLTFKVAGGYVSAVPNTTTPATVKFSFILQAFNPSGRVRIYYTGIICTFKGQANGSVTAKGFVKFPLPDIAPEQQSLTETIAFAAVNSSTVVPQAYFNWLLKGHNISDAMLILNGTRTVENYSGHNLTSEPGTIYYCPSITIGGDNPGHTAADTPICSEHLPESASV